MAGGGRQINLGVRPGQKYSIRL